MLPLQSRLKVEKLPLRLQGHRQHSSKLRIARQGRPSKSSGHQLHGLRPSMSFLVAATVSRPWLISAMLPPQEGT